MNNELINININYIPIDVKHSLSHIGVTVMPCVHVHACIHDTETHVRTIAHKFILPRPTYFFIILAPYLY